MLRVLVPPRSSWALSLDRALNPRADTWQCRRTCGLSQNSPNSLHLAGETVPSTGIAFKSYCLPRVKFQGHCLAEPREDLQPEALSWQRLPGTLLLKCNSLLLIAVHMTPSSQRDGPGPPLLKCEGRICFWRPPCPACESLNAATALAEATALAFSACLNTCGIRLAEIRHVSVKLKMSFHSLLAFREGVWAEWITIKQGRQMFAFFFFFSLGEGGVTVIKVKFDFSLRRSFIAPACRLLLSAFGCSL